MTHTPGPWAYDNTDPEGGAILAQYQGSRKGRFRVALVDDEMEAVDANARLIAASPDLLAALKAVCGTIISSGSGPAAPTFDEFDAQVERKRRHWYTIDAAAVDAARAAIEKAEGK